MTDAEKIAQLEQKVAQLKQEIAEQERRGLARDRQLIAIEKNGAVVGDQVKQNAKDIRRVENQTADRFDQLMSLMNEGFARVENNFNRVETNLKNDIIRTETNLKNDINRVEGQMIKWLSLIVAIAVIIIGALTYMKG